jgi:bifunctional UDP-N-acetylglucosamine pyrophosphorylase/glucosamine-1-phosphate N-acetyltransferase
MDAVILAAGLGLRLRPHTLTTPKPLLHVRGRPILNWTLAALPKEVSRVVVVTHHLAEQFTDYLRTQTHFADWATVHQAHPRGTGDALKACRDAVGSERFLVLNGDDLYGAADLAALLRHPCGMLAHPVDDPGRFGIAFLKEDGSGTLDRLLEKPADLAGPRLANIGAYLFPRWVFDVELPLSPRGEYEITDAVSAVAARAPFHVVPARAWLPIGTVEAWRAAEALDLPVVLGVEV